MQQFIFGGPKSGARRFSRNVMGGGYVVAASESAWQYGTLRPEFTQR